MMLVSTVMSWRCAEWFMALDSPTASQSAFVSVVYGRYDWRFSAYGWGMNIGKRLSAKTMFKVIVLACLVSNPDMCWEYHDTRGPYKNI